MPELKALPVQYRSLTLNAPKVDAEARSVEVACTSELVADRWWGREQLDHSPGAIVMDRAGSDRGLPLLFNHDMNQLLGRALGFRLDEVDRVTRATAVFDQGEEGTERWGQVQEGSLVDVSLGYRIHEYTTIDPGMPTERYLITSWEPVELSFCTVPADHTVGANRSTEGELFPVRSITPNPPGAAGPGTVKEIRMPELENPTGAPQAPAPPVVDAQQERAFSLQLRSLAAKHGLDKDAEELLGSNKTQDEIRSAFFGLLEKRTAPAPAPTSDQLGLNEGEKRRYSLGRAIQAIITRDFSQAGFEREVSQALSKRMGKDTAGIFVPNDFQTRSANTLNTTTTNKGKELVFSEYAGWIGLLRNKAYVLRMGVDFRTGLSNNLSFVKQTAGGTVYWVGENPGADVTETTLGLTTVNMTPKTLKGMLSFTAQELAQGVEAIDALAERELLMIHALELDRVVLNGSGSGNQPTGILNTSGIGSVAMGTNGLAISSIAPLVDLETAVANANADIDNMAYITTPGQRGVMRKTAAFSTAGAAPIWGEGPSVDGFHSVNGYKACATNQMPSNLTKGTSNGICHAILLGNWADCIVGEWGGGLELVIDPYTLAGQDITRVISRQLIDVGVKRAASFAAIKDAL